MKIFEDIQTYMTRSQDERRAHLDLSQPCVEIGGTSQQFRGLLAHFLGTTISTTRGAVLCHACHNGKCSNVQHLYWGTYSENLVDAYANGRKSISQLLNEKHDEETLKEIRSKAGRAPRKRYGNRYTTRP